MPKTFRDYITESKLEVPESVKAPTAKTSYEEIPPSEQVPTYVSEGPKTNAENVDYTGLYTADDNIKKLNQSTPFLGGIVGAVQEIKDSWTQNRREWKSTVEGLKDIKDNPQMAYYLANMMLRALNGPEKVLPYNNDLDTSNLVVKIMDKIGVGSILDKLGIGKVGGEPFTMRGYISDDAVNISSEKDTVTKYQDDGQGIVTEGTGNIEIYDKGESLKGKKTVGTRRFLKSIVNVPLFSIDSKDGFFSPFLTEDYLGKNNTSLKDLSKLKGYYSQPGPDWDLTTMSAAGEQSLVKRYLNYQSIVSPYKNDSFLSSSPLNTAAYILNELGALSGYEPYAGFSPRNDNVWSMRLYPYAPGKEYSNDRKDNTEYYNSTITPPLPITYIPAWTYDRTKTGSERFSTTIREFDWEKYTPIQSYELMYGNLKVQDLELFGGSGVSFPEMFDYKMKLNLTILDDVDATFSKYMNMYFNRIYDKKTNSRAPLEYSMFVAELIIFKPALNINFHFKFIVTPIDYVPDLSGSENDSTSAALKQMSFSVWGMKDFTRKSNGIGRGVLPNDISENDWNSVTLAP